MKQPVVQTFGSSCSLKETKGEKQSILAGNLFITFKTKSGF
jgi:hypothetical protein